MTEGARPPASTLRQILGLCAGVRVAMDAVESAGLLDDDRAWGVLTVMERWCAGEVEPGEVEEALGVCAALAEELRSPAAGRSPALAILGAAVDCVARAVRDARWAGDSPVAIDRTALSWAEAVLEVLGEDEDGARLRVTGAWAIALHPP